MMSDLNLDQSLITHTQNSKIHLSPNRMYDREENLINTNISKQNVDLNYASTSNYSLSQFVLLCCAV